MSDEADVVETMRRAVTAVRREGYKAAVIYAVLDGTLLGVGVSLLLSTVGVDPFPHPYLPGAAAAVGAIGSFAYRIRQPLVERFEAVNPDIQEALRTARDAIESGETNTMTRALYADVIDRLQHTSSVGLLDLPRIGARFVLLFALSLAVIQASVAGVDLGSVSPGPVGGDGGNGGGGPIGSTPTPAGLQPGDDVLGTPEMVTPGGDNISAEVDQQAGLGDDEQQREYETGGLGDDTAVSAEQAGYAPPDDIENAELIKEYNLRIREEADD